MILRSTHLAMRRRYAPGGSQAHRPSFVLKFLMRRLCAIYHVRLYLVPSPPRAPPPSPRLPASPRREERGGRKEARREGGNENGEGKTEERGRRKREQGGGRVRREEGKGGRRREEGGGRGKEEEEEEEEERKNCMQSFGLCAKAHEPMIAVIFDNLAYAPRLCAA